MSKDAFKKLSTPMTFEDVAADLERENRFVGKPWRVFFYFMTAWGCGHFLIIFPYELRGLALPSGTRHLPMVFGMLGFYLAFQQWKHARQLKALLDAIKELKEKQS